MTPKPAATNRRIVFLASVFVLLLAAALGRAVWLQAVKGPELAAMAVRQHRETVVVPAGRGTIFDRNGEPLAIGRQATTVYANPRQVDRPRDLTLAVEQLTTLVGRVSLRDLIRDTTALVERYFIEAALELAEQNRTTAVEILGVSRQSLYVKLRRYGTAKGPNGAPSKTARPKSKAKHKSKGKR